VLLATDREAASDAKKSVDNLRHAQAEAALEASKALTLAMEQMQGAADLEAAANWFKQVATGKHCQPLIGVPKSMHEEQDRMATLAESYAGDASRKLGV
jgi:hypothetical protein